MENLPKFQNKRTIFITALICMFLWGSAVPVTKLSYTSLDMAQSEVFTRIHFAGLRFLLASFMVLGYIYFSRREKDGKQLRELKGKDWLFLLVIGLLRITLCYYFYYIALANISGVKGAIFVSSSTFLTVLIAPFAVREDRFNQGKLLALLLGFSGIIVANAAKGFDLSLTFRGEGYMLLSGVFSALVEVTVKPRSKGIPAPLISWGQLFFGSIPLLVVGYLGLEHSLPWDFKAIGLLIYSALISAVAFILWYELLKVNDAGELAIYRLFIPIFGSLLSALLLPAESFTASLLLGLLLVVAGIIVLNIWGRQKSEQKKESNS